MVKHYIVLLCWVTQGEKLNHNLPYAWSFILNVINFCEYSIANTGCICGWMKCVSERRYICRYFMFYRCDILCVWMDGNGMKNKMWNDLKLYCCKKSFDTKISYDCPKIAVD